ncbi:MAG: hypothetical protein SO575_03510, partial [Sodaliphilus sp.]|nr:hypothetical protein [Sodaliphilus sp.]
LFNSADLQVLETKINVPVNMEWVHIHNLPQVAAPKIGVASFFYFFFGFFFLILFENACIIQSR